MRVPDTQILDSHACARVSNVDRVDTPDAQAADYVQGLALTECEFALVKEQLESGSRRFLVKQGHHSVVCQLDLKGFEAELAVISGRASSVELMHGIIAAVRSRSGALAAGVHELE